MNIPAYRWGQPYASLEVDEVSHFETGEPIRAKDVRYGIARSFASEEITGGPQHLIDREPMKELV